MKFNNSNKIIRASVIFIIVTATSSCAINYHINSVCKNSTLSPFASNCPDTKEDQKPE